MIKSLVTISILVGLLTSIIGYGDIFSIILRVKGSFLIILGSLFSSLAIFMIFAEIAHEVIGKFLKRL